MGDSDRYDDAFREALADDDRPAARSSSASRCATSATPPTCSRPTFDATDGPGRLRLVRAARRRWPFDAEGSIEEAERLTRRRSTGTNVLIKVPGTAEGVAGVRGADRARRQRQHDAAVRGRALQRDRRGVRPRRSSAASRPASRSTAVASVASFFVSRVDTKVDAELERLGREDLRGKAAVANAQHRLRVLPARSSPASAGSAARPRARTCSGRCGPRPRRRTPTTRTRCTSTS